jgi:hypothetical protein
MRRERRTWSGGGEQEVGSGYIFFWLVPFPIVFLGQWGVWLRPNLRQWCWSCLFLFFFFLVWC